MIAPAILESTGTNLPEKSIASSQNCRRECATRSNRFRRLAGSKQIDALRSLFAAYDQRGSLLFRLVRAIKSSRRPPIPRRPAPEFGKVVPFPYTTEGEDLATVGLKNTSLRSPLRPNS